MKIANRLVRHNYNPPDHKKSMFRFLVLFSKLLILFLSFLVSKLCFLSFSTQNHAEPSGNFIKNSILDISLHNPFFSKFVVFSLQTTFFDGTTVFFRFLADIYLRTPIKPPQKGSSRTISCNVHPTCTLP